jgi:hypothetical protein
MAYTVPPTPPASPCLIWATQNFDTDRDNVIWGTVAKNVDVLAECIVQRTCPNCPCNDCSWHVFSNAKSYPISRRERKRRASRPTSDAPILQTHHFPPSDSNGIPLETHIGLTDVLAAHTVRRFCPRCRCIECTQSFTLAAPKFKLRSNKRQALRRSNRHGI